MPGSSGHCYTFRCDILEVKHQHIVKKTCLWCELAFPQSLDGLCTLQLSRPVVQDAAVLKQLLDWALHDRVAGGTAFLVRLPLLPSAFTRISLLVLTEQALLAEHHDDQPVGQTCCTALPWVTCPGVQLLCWLAALCMPYIGMSM